MANCALPVRMLLLRYFWHWEGTGEGGQRRRLSKGAGKTFGKKEGGRGKGEVGKELLVQVAGRPILGQGSLNVAFLFSYS